MHALEIAFEPQQSYGAHESNQRATEDQGRHQNLGPQR